MARFALALLLLGLSPRLLSAAPAGEAPHPEEPEVGSGARFLAGGLLAFGAHEAGHLAFDVAFDAHPGIKKVDFAGIPFFAITHRPGLSSGRELAISSAGFWTQHATSEWILTRRPGLRRARAPLAKGILAFDLLASVAYAGAAFAHAGPAERDTRGMAQALGVGEGWVGAMVLAPALLDGYRYARPQARWAKWTSRGVKAALVLLVVVR